MDDHDVPGWTLDELARRVALALPGAGLAGGRVREVPDQRAIRWYASIGVMDRPIGGRGRGARYGVRHLRQLVAVKRLQAQGLTLAAVQARLAGVDDATLGVLAAVPPEALAELPAAPPPRAAPSDRTASDTAPPGSATAEPAGGESPLERAMRGAVSAPGGQGGGLGTRRDTQFWRPTDAPVSVGEPLHPRHPIRPLAGLCLADDVLLVLPQQPSPGDLPVLVEAAAPLLAALAALGLVPDPTRESHDDAASPPRSPAL